MRNRFNINEEEKNRIRRLHSVIKEQQIDLEVDPVVVDPMGPEGPTRTPETPRGGGQRCYQMTMEKCYGPPGTQPVGTVGHAPCAQVDGQTPGPGLVGQIIYGGGGSPPGTQNPQHSAHVVLTVTPNPAGVPYGHFKTTQTCNVGGGQQDQCQCCTAGGGAISMNGLVPAGTCSSYNSNTLSNCQVAPAQGSIHCGPQRQDHCVDCKQSIMIPILAGTDCPHGSILLQGTSPNFIPPCYECDGNGNCNGPGWFNGGSHVFNSQQDCQQGVPGQPACPIVNDDHDCVGAMCVATPGGQYPSLGACQAVCGGGANCAQLIPNFMALCDAKEQDAINGLASGCNWICNKVNALTAQQPFPNTPQGIRKQCKLDYVQTAANNVPCINSNTGNCTSGSQSGTLSQTWIDLMTNRYNGTGGPSGCWGISGNNTNSVCGRKAYFCGLPSQSPMQQAKCAWLTTFTANNNCNC